MNSDVLICIYEVPSCCIYEFENMCTTMQDNILSA